MLLVIPTWQRRIAYSLLLSLSSHRPCAIDLPRLSAFSILDDICALMCVTNDAASAYTHCLWLAFRLDLIFLYLLMCQEGKKTLLSSFLLTYYSWQSLPLKSSLSEIERPVVKVFLFKQLQCLFEIISWWRVNNSSRYIISFRSLSLYFWHAIQGKSTKCESWMQIQIEQLIKHGPHLLQREQEDETASSTERNAEWGEPCTDESCEPKRKKSDCDDSPQKQL